MYRRSEHELKQGIKLLRERLKHQQSEVVQARKKLGLPAFGKRYLARMKSNCEATRKMLRGYEKALKRR